jgi:hypothetical protein
MLQRPFPAIRKIFRKNNSDAKELMKFIFEKTDSILLWLIGLSIATIAFLSSKFSDLNKLFTVDQTKCIFLFLFISVGCGIIYRLIYLWYYILIDGAFRQIDISLSETDMVDIESDLDGTETFEYLFRQNSEYQDLPDFLGLYNKTDEKQKAELYEYMVGLYKSEAAYAKKEFDLALSTVEDAYNSALGTKMKLTNLTDAQINKPVKTIKILRVVSIVLYLAFIVSFLFAIGYLLYVVKFPIT